MFSWIYNTVDHHNCRPHRGRLQEGCELGCWNKVVGCEANHSVHSWNFSAWFGLEPEGLVLAWLGWPDFLGDFGMNIWMNTHFHDGWMFGWFGANFFLVTEHCCIGAMGSSRSTGSNSSPAVVDLHGNDATSVSANFWNDFWLRIIPMKQPALGQGLSQSFSISMAWTADISCSPRWMFIFNRS